MGMVRNSLLGNVGKQVTEPSNSPESNSQLLQSTHERSQRDSVASDKSIASSDRSSIHTLVTPDGQTIAHYLSPPGIPNPDVPPRHVPSPLTREDVERVLKALDVPDHKILLILEWYDRNGYPNDIQVINRLALENYPPELPNGWKKISS